MEKIQYFYVFLIILNECVIIEEEPANCTSATTFNVIICKYSLEIFQVSDCLHTPLQLILPAICR